VSAVLGLRGRNAAHLRQAEIQHLDLTGVPYMDSCALGAIMGMHRPSQSHQRQCAIVGASERLRSMFRIARVDDILAQFATVEEAEQKLGAKAAGN